MQAWHWLLAVLGLGCAFALAWGLYQMRRPVGFDADLIQRYGRGEVSWRELERQQRNRRRRRGGDDRHVPRG